MIVIIATAVTAAQHANCLCHFQYVDSTKLDRFKFNVLRACRIWNAPLSEVKCVARGDRVQYWYCNAKRSEYKYKSTVARTFLLSRQTVNNARPWRIGYRDFIRKFCQRARTTPSLRLFFSLCSLRPVFSPSLRNNTIGRVHAQHTSKRIELYANELFMTTSTRGPVSKIAFVF